MATLHYALKASPAVIYPALVLVAYLQKNKLLKDLRMISQDGRQLDDDSAVRLTLQDGTIFRDFVAFRHLAMVASGIPGSPSLHIVGIPYRGFFLLL